MLQVFLFLSNNSKSMKKIIIFFIFNNLVAQNNNAIQFDSITINSTSIFEDQSYITQKLKLKNSGENYFNEMEDKLYPKFQKNINNYYQPSYFLFENNQLVHFCLLDASFCLIHSKIKVGNKIDYIQRYFPESFKNREVKNELGFIVIDLYMDDGKTSDTFIVINYQPITEIITSIHLGEY